MKIILISKPKLTCLPLIIIEVSLRQLKPVFHFTISLAAGDILIYVGQHLAGTPELGGGGGGRRGGRPRCPLPGGARGAKVPFQFKGLPWRNSELSEVLVQFLYEFASENARNAVIELQV